MKKFALAAAAALFAIVAAAPASAQTGMGDTQRGAHRDSMAMKMEHKTMHREHRRMHHEKRMHREHRKMGHHRHTM